jgi:predicted AAA+ superfamily ATPase
LKSPLRWYRTSSLQFSFCIIRPGKTSRKLYISRTEEKIPGGILLQKTMECDFITNYIHLSEGTIITFDQEDQIMVSGKTIKLTPAWKMWWSCVTQRQINGNP